MKILGKQFMSAAVMVLIFLNISPAAGVQSLNLKVRSIASESGVVAVFAEIRVPHVALLISSLWNRALSIHHGSHFTLKYIED